MSDLLAKFDVERGATQAGFAVGCFEGFFEGEPGRAKDQQGSNDDGPEGGAPHRSELLVVEDGGSERGIHGDVAGAEGKRLPKDSRRNGCARHDVIDEIECL